MNTPLPDEQARIIIRQLRDANPMLVAVAMTCVHQGIDATAKLSEWSDVADEETARAFLWLVDYYKQQEGGQG